ncbi:MAG: DUF3962 domain-containing protein [Dolichospermum sp. LBC05a]|nr:DUF3962 domain-containing protein [Dolichospermum sp. OL01]MCO5797240.1 DUF3962 domain-containing protein [Dolichospermum sp. OL03]MCS6280864.1 DUF3962 domain-containing protein [Dolichospermum sp.]QSV58775.1 MAG: DUF3962 domain-containing protein [Dolichospermum sp. LBC05a]
MNTKQYVYMGQKSIDSLFLALTIPDNIEPVKIYGYTISWTLEALAKFELIKTSIKDKNKNLPYASLTGLLQIAFDNLVYLHSDITLKNTKINNKQPESFAYLNQGNYDSIKRQIRTVMNDWITHYLQPYVKNNKSDSKLVDELFLLWEQDHLINISDKIEYQLLPWKCSKTGTTTPNPLENSNRNNYAYKDLVEYIARQIAGKEIFENCGTMKRIISEHSSGQAKLMTDPISLEGEEGKYSLVITLEIITFPSVHQPVLRIDVSKRRWIYDLTKARYGLGNIKGYIFSEQYNDRVFQYKLICQKNQDRKYSWNIDQDFEPLRRKFALPLTVNSGEDIALGRASTPENKVMLTFKNGLQKTYDIQDGVPEIDKLKAYRAISQFLEPIGFIPFDSYEEIDVKHPDQPDEVNNVTLLITMLKTLENHLTSNTYEDFLQLSRSGKNDIFKKHFGISLDNIDIDVEEKLIEYNTKTTKDRHKTKLIIKYIQEMQQTIQTNNEALQRLYPDESLQLIIFYQDDLEKDLNFVKNIAQIIWGGKVEIKSTRLPENVHGCRGNLPGKQLKEKERSKLRIEEWKKITEQLNNLDQRTFCLILAKEWYGKDHDDIINKPSTRQALASLAGSAVQFLLPIEITKKGLFKLEDYFYRVQSALKDLLSAHSGRIDKIQEKVNTYLKNISPEKRPKEIIGVTIVRKQRGRVRGHLEQTYLLIATRLNVETGICELRCAYDQNNNLETSQWDKFADGIAFVSQISPVKLASEQSKKKNKDIDKIRFADLLKTIISESVNNGNNPVVMIDSSNCSKLCGWLADVRITTCNINLNQQYQHMEDNWKGARIIRIRQDLAPGFIEEKVRQYAETTLEDNRQKEELTFDYEIPSATSPPKRLFRLTAISETGCVTYLSIGNKTLHQK